MNFADRMYFNMEPRPIQMSILYYAVELVRAMPDRKILCIKLLRWYPGSDLDLREAKTIIEFAMEQETQDFVLKLRSL